MTPAEARLAKYRAKAESAQNERYRNWREWRFRSTLPFGTELAGRGEKGERYTDDKETYGPLVWNSKDVGGRNHTGWYADNFQDSLILFGVAKVRTPRGPLYVAVTWNTGADGATYHFNHSTLVSKEDSRADSNGWSAEWRHDEAIREVSHWADSCAEHEAEEERKHDAEFQAEHQIEDAQEAIRTAKDELRELLRERREKRKIESPAICRAITDTARRLIADIRESRERIEELQDNYWHAVEF
jgi:hypothetical protein